MRLSTLSDGSHNVDWLRLYVPLLEATGEGACRWH